MDVILMEERGGEGSMIVINGGRLSLEFLTYLFLIITFLENKHNPSCNSKDE